MSEALNFRVVRFDGFDLFYEPYEGTMEFENFADAYYAYICWQWFADGKEIPEPIVKQHGYDSAEWVNK